jgi:hypothetical protein
MDEDNTLNFCTGCGANIRSSDEFCPSCGLNLREKKAPAARQYEQKTYRLYIVAALGLIWAIYALYDGINTISNIDRTMNDLVNTPYWDLISGSTEDLIRTMMLTMGYIMIASAILAAITAVFCILKKMYIVALIACILGSILSLIFIVGFIGLFCAYLITKSKWEFEGTSQNY